MTFHVFSILDNKSHLYSPPFLSRHTGEAIRSFTDLVNDERSSVSKYPGDYQLVMLGEFDDEAGMFINQKQVFLGGADQYKKPATQLSLLAKDN